MRPTIFHAACTLLAAQLIPSLAVAQKSTAASPTRRRLHFTRRTINPMEAGHWSKPGKQLSSERSPDRWGRTPYATGKAIFIEGTSKWFPLAGEGVAIKRTIGERELERAAPVQRRMEASRAIWAVWFPGRDRPNAGPLGPALTGVTRANRIYRLLLLTLIELVVLHEVSRYVVNVMVGFSGAGNRSSTRYCRGRISRDRSACANRGCNRAGRRRGYRRYQIHRGGRVLGLRRVHLARHPRPTLA